MSPSLPPEMLDLIVDYLQDEPDALKSCCKVSKSWVPRTRKHLFAKVVFEQTGTTIRSWMEAFPDPSNSPAHYTREFWIVNPGIVSASVCACILSFRCVEELAFSTFGWGGPGEIPLAQLHGLSPNLKTLHLVSVFTPISEILDLICSFPLLDDLSLSSHRHNSDADRWTPPAASPKLRGSLRLTEENRSITRGLLDFPDGLHFSGVHVEGQVKDMDFGTINDLLLRCSNTMETLFVAYSPTDTPLTPPPIDLSKAAKLKDLQLQWDGQDVRWITETLQTANSEVLHKIKIHCCGAPFIPTGQILGEWRELDCLLVQMWRSRSVVPNIAYWGELGSLPSLLPELAKRGALSFLYCG